MSLGLSDVATCYLAFLAPLGYLTVGLDDVCRELLKAVHDRNNHQVSVKVSQYLV